MRSNLEQNFMFDTILKSGRFGTTAKLLTGNYAIQDGASPAHFLDPNGSTRNVTLPENKLGRHFYIFNVGGSGFLHLRTDLAVLLAIIGPGGGAAVVSEEDEWGLLAGNAGGFPSYQVRSATGTITVDATTDDHILVGAGVATINLPASGDRTTGRGYYFVDDTIDGDVNAKTIVPSGVQTIMGLASVTIPLGGAVEIFPRPSGGWYGKVF